MSKPLFRQKSLDKITSPEQMGDYIRVSNPSVWMILGRDYRASCRCLRLGLSDV